MTDQFAALRAKAEAATDDWYFPSELMEATDNEADAAYIAAANPQTILRLLDLLDSMIRERDAIAEDEQAAYEVIERLDRPGNRADGAERQAPR